MQTYQISASPNGWRKSKPYLRTFRTREAAVYSAQCLADEMQSEVRIAEVTGEKLGNGIYIWPKSQQVNQVISEVPDL